MFLVLFPVFSCRKHRVKNTPIREVAEWFEWISVCVSVFCLAVFLWFRLCVVLSSKILRWIYPQKLEKSKNFPTYPWNIPQTQNHSFHLGVWGGLGYAPGVCWGFLRRRQHNLKNNDKQQSYLQMLLKPQATLVPIESCSEWKTPWLIEC